MGEFWRAGFLTDERANPRGVFASGDELPGAGDADQTVASAGLFVFFGQLFQRLADALGAWFDERFVLADFFELFGGGAAKVAQFGRREWFLRGEKNGFNGETQVHRRLGKFFLQLRRWRVCECLQLCVRSVFRIGALFQLDFSEGFPLDGLDEAKPYQFEHGQKGADDFRPGTGVGEEFGETNSLFLEDDVPDELNFLADGEWIGVNVSRVGFLLLDSGEDGVDGLEKVEDRDLRVLFGGFDGGECGFAGVAGKDVFLGSFEVLESAGGVFELFIFDELADEFPARIFVLVVFWGLVLFFFGEQFAAFDVHESGGHNDEFAGDMNVPFPHLLDVLDEFGGQSSEVHLIDIHFLLADEVKQKVKRAFVNFKLDFVCGHLPLLRNLCRRFCARTSYP